MDFNKVKTFLIVAERGNISKAAQILGRTQPAVSQAIQQLEENLGLTLLERRGGKIYLTPEGESLRQMGNRTLVSLEEGIADLRKDMGSVSGTFRLGTVIDHAGSLLAQRLTHFQTSNPKVNVHVSYGKSDVLEQRLLNNELDAAILINFKQRRLFDVFSFSIEQEILVTSPLYLDRFGAIKDYERVLNASIIDMSPDFDCFRPWLAKNRKGLLPRLARRTPALIIESHQGMRDVVKSGFGIAMLPKHLIHDDWKQGTLVQLLKQSKPTEVGIELAIRKKRTDKLVNTLFVQHLLGDTNAR